MRDLEEILEAINQSITKLELDVASLKRDLGYLQGDVRRIEIAIQG